MNTDRTKPILDDINKSVLGGLVFFKVITLRLYDNHISQTKYKTCQVISVYYDESMMSYTRSAIGEMDEEVEKFSTSLPRLRCIDSCTWFIREEDSETFRHTDGKPYISYILLFNDVDDVLQNLEHLVHSINSVLMENKLTETYE